MLRAIAYLLITVFLISFLRMVIGIIGKGFSEMVGPSPPPESKPGAAGAASIKTGGELKKDPVCGTYVSTATSYQKKVGGETHYFCSAACRDKFAG
jgi:YHS domain-containing protein